MKNVEVCRVPLMNGQAVGLTGETTIADWLQLIRAEYAEVPGLHLTNAEVQDLWGLDAWVSDILLKVLVDAGFLRRTGDDRYVRADGEEFRTTPGHQIQHAARLVSAKEGERRRIVRELHDDISRRLALLAIEIERMVQQAPDPDTLRDLLQKTNEIAKGVRHLSHQLHPVTLEALGIVGEVAIESRPGEGTAVEARVPRSAA